MSRNPTVDTHRSAVAARVREVADLTANGHKAGDIAVWLGVHRRSVERYLARARKTGLLPKRPT